MISRLQENAFLPLNIYGKRQQMWSLVFKLILHETLVSALRVSVWVSAPCISVWVSAVCVSVCVSAHSAEANPHTHSVWKLCASAEV